MPPRDPLDRIRDMIDAAEAIGSFVEGLDLEAFRHDRRTVDAILRNIAVLGEAVRAVPAEIRALRPEIPWTDVADMRNVVVHEYFGVDLDILWRTATEEVPALLDQLRALVAQLEAEG